jgi:di/tricarboxylate transporter
LLEQLGESRREYLLEMMILPGCRLVGQTIETAGLRRLPGLFLIEVDRDGEVIGPVGPEERLQADDRLVFTGIVSSILELEKIPGLVPATDPSYEILPARQRGRRLCEAVISEQSPLIGQSIREADFRARYGAAVVAVQRGGERVAQKLGDIVLRAGDTLLLQVPPHFSRAFRHDPSFYLISDIDDWRPVRRDRLGIAVVIFALLLTSMTLGLLPVALSSILAAVAMVALGCISAGDARNSVEWQVLLTIGASFGVGTALHNTGAASAVAQLLVQSSATWGPIAALAAIYIITSLVTEMITNNAAAVLLFPFCLETSRIYQVDSRPFIMALILAASASFMTPIGYQTNMMVYGPGGYKMSDFIRIGVPLHVFLTIIAVLLIPLIWPF